jgi:DNA anti-recombination protein RmuC
MFREAYNEYKECAKEETRKREKIIHDSETEIKAIHSSYEEKMKQIERDHKKRIAEMEIEHEEKMKKIDSINSSIKAELERAKASHDFSKVLEIMTKQLNMIKNGEI